MKLFYIRITYLNQTIHLTGFLLLIIYFTSSNTWAGTGFDPDSLHNQLIDEANHAGISASLVLAVTQVESGFNPSALGEDNGRGLMQITPSIAWRQYGVEADELWDPRLNIRIGVQRLAWLVDLYRGQRDLALSHYAARLNVREPVLKQVLSDTRGYVEKVNQWQVHFESEDDEESHRSHPTRPSSTSFLPKNRFEMQRVLPLDDFDQDIKLRRQRIRPQLDDFTNCSKSYHFSTYLR